MGYRIQIFHFRMFDVTVVSLPNISDDPGIDEYEEIYLEGGDIGQDTHEAD